MIRVLVKASSPLAQAGLETLLRESPTLRPLENASEVTHAINADSPPDVWLVETDNLSDPAARTAMDFAAAGGPVVLLVHDPPADAVAEALRAGIRALLSSSRTGAEIVAAVEAAAAGLVVLDPNGLETLLRARNVIWTGGTDSPIEALTPREVEVLQLLAAGLGNKEIAPRLGISEHTVKFHVASIMGKLEASSRTEAVTLGIRRGLIMV